MRSCGEAWTCPAWTSPTSASRTANCTARATGRLCENRGNVIRTATPIVLITLLASSCGAPRESAESSKASAPVTRLGPTVPPAPGTVTRGDASTNLDTTPLSAADYALYTSIMGGASAMLSVLSPEDTAALEFAKKVDAGTARVTPAPNR